MYKKKFIQLSLLIFILIITFFIFKNYFQNENPEPPLQNVAIINKEGDQPNENNNLIKKIKYNAEDKNGNNYTIISEFGELSQDIPDLILMTNVSATIEMNNRSQIEIFSNSAQYNSFNYDTVFEGNVLMLYENHKISSEKLDLIFARNIAILSGNIIYKNLNTILEADKIEFDLITKNSKVFMNKKSEKVKIISLN